MVAIGHHHIGCQSALPSMLSEGTTKKIKMLFLFYRDDYCSMLSLIMIWLLSWLLLLLLLYKESTGMNWTLLIDFSL